MVPVGQNLPLDAAQATAIDFARQFLPEVAKALPEYARRLFSAAGLPVPPHPFLSIASPL